MSSPACLTTWPTPAAAARPAVPMSVLPPTAQRLLAYTLDRGTLAPIGRYEVDVEHPERAAELARAVAVARSRGDADADFSRTHLRPVQALHSVGHMRNSCDFGPRSVTNPKCVKRNLWDGLLRQVYGDDVGSDALFLQHTYLTILVKAIAARVLDLAVDDPAELLSGRLLANEGIVGAVEADFFDWPLIATGGDDLVRSLAGETNALSPARRRGRRAQEPLREPDRSRRASRSG